ncbi:MAG: ABC transporter ATP-binding protein [Bacillota bacterium]
MPKKEKKPPKKQKHERPNNIKGTLKRLIQYLKPEMHWVVAIFLCVTTTTFLILFSTRMIGVIIDTCIVDFDAEGLLKWSVVLLVAYGVSSLTTWLQNYAILVLAQNVVVDIRADVVEKFQNLPLSYFDKTPFGELMSRITNDVESISTAVESSLTTVFQSILTLSTTFIMMLFLSIEMTFASLCTVPLVLVIMKYIAEPAKNIFMKRQEKLGELNGYIDETITGQRVVKTFSREKIVIEEFNELNDNLLASGIKAELFSGMVGPMMVGISNLSYIIVVTVGAIMMSIPHTGMTIGLISNFVIYSRQFTRPISDIAGQVNTMMAAFASAERVFDILDETEEMEDQKEAVELTEIQGKVEFVNVDFSYDKKVPVLKNINLSVKEGQTVAFVGATGAGKTTMINLLSRFYDVDNGSILIDGRGIEMIQRKSMRSQLAIVLQDTYLFTDTILENIRYGRLDATKEEIISAAKLSNAHEFIMKLSGGYDFILEENGGNLSQGQRQMISVARAILANPSILILDEATSNVDTRTEKKIQEGMKNLMVGRTNFVIAHRLGTIREADMIVVIDHGEIVEKGTHEALVSQDGFYAKLHRQGIGLGGIS